MNRKHPEALGTKQYGSWQVVGWLGGGGAGDVYEVRGVDEARAALKVFRQDRRAKVVHKHDLEINFMDVHRQYPGILTLIDAQLEEAEDRSFWYVTPWAEPLNKATDILANPYEVIRTIATVAATLSDLALQGIHHRNLKPSNIFLYEGKPVVGDFAFIPIDETIDLTNDTNDSSTEFVAPETRSHGALIDAEKADVFSLAKTLLVTLGSNGQDIAGLQKLITSATADDPKARPNMARLGGELLAIFDRAEIAVFPEPAPHLDAAVGRLNRLLEGESTDETRRVELVRQARAIYAALVASTIGTSLNSLSRVRSLQVQEVVMGDADIKIPTRRASLLHKGADGVVASVPGAVLTVDIHAGFWDGIQSELLKVSVQREWGEANISMRIHWVEADRDTEVWTFGWQQSLKAARSARSFNELSRQTTEHLAVAYEYLSNWVERREMPDL